MHILCFRPLHADCMQIISPKIGKKVLHFDDLACRGITNGGGGVTWANGANDGDETK